jgi:putative ABC transport system permease protein
LIESFYKLMKFSGGDRYRNQFRWLQNILKAFGLLWLLWIPVAIASYFYPALQLY